MQHPRALGTFLFMGVLLQTNPSVHVFAQRDTVESYGSLQ